MSLGLAIPESTDDPNGFVARMVQTVFLLVTLILPLLHLIILFVLWVTPMSRRIQRYIFTCSEILHAWNSLEVNQLWLCCSLTVKVFVVSVIASLLELGQFAQFLVSGKCDGINVILKKYFDEALDGDDTCFDVISTLDSGCWLLFASSVIYLFTSVVVMRICHKALSDRGAKGPLIN